MNYPTFTGEEWSHADAIRRAPHAWRKVVETFGSENQFTREHFERICPPGLGHWERSGKAWIYVEPSGYAHRVNEHYGQDEPPPLPRPKSEWRKCGCGAVHFCLACGQPYWNECHGYADGACSYCYHVG